MKITLDSNGSPFVAYHSIYEITGSKVVDLAILPSESKRIVDITQSSNASAVAAEQIPFQQHQIPMQHYLYNHHPQHNIPTSIPQAQHQFQHPNTSSSSVVVPTSIQPLFSLGSGNAAIEQLFQHQSAPQHSREQNIASSRTRQIPSSAPVVSTAVNARIPFDPAIISVNICLFVLYFYNLWV